MWGETAQERLVLGVYALRGVEDGQVHALPVLALLERQVPGGGVGQFRWSGTGLEQRGGDDRFPDALPPA